MSKKTALKSNPRVIYAGKGVTKETLVATTLQESKDNAVEGIGDEALRRTFIAESSKQLPMLLELLQQYGTEEVRAAIEGSIRDIP
jgi:hypothetical protein